MATVISAIPSWDAWNSWIRIRSKKKSESAVWRREVEDCQVMLMFDKFQLLLSFAVFSPYTDRLIYASRSLEGRPVSLRVLRRRSFIPDHKELFNNEQSFTLRWLSINKYDTVLSFFLLWFLWILLIAACRSLKASENRDARFWWWRHFVALSRLNSFLDYSTINLNVFLRGNLKIFM